MSEDMQQFAARYVVPKGFDAAQLLNVSCRAAAEYIADEYGDELMDEDAKDYKGVSIYIDSDHDVTVIRLIAEYHGDPAIAAAGILAMQALCGDHTLHVISWSYSREGVDPYAFGGGAVGIQQGEEPFYVYPEQEVLEHFDNLSQ